MSAVAAIRDDGTEAGRWATLASAARATDRPANKIGDALRSGGTCGGYSWVCVASAPCTSCGKTAANLDAVGRCQSCCPAPSGRTETPSEIVTRFGLEALRSKTDDELKALTGYATAAQKRKYFRLRAKIHGAWE